MAIKTADQITIVDVTDAYSVNLSSEAYTFAGNTSGKLASATTCTTTVYISQGSTQITPKSITASTLNGISNTTVGTLSAAGTDITFNAASGFGGGEITLTITLLDDTVFYKKFSMAVARTGATGAAVYTHVRYSANANGSSFVASPTSSTKYIGIYTGTSSTAPTSNTSYTWSKFIGEDGSDGDDGTSYYTYVRYGTNSSGAGMTSAPTSSTKYIGIYSGTASTAPTSANSYTWSLYVGADGNDGEDAITFDIIASGSTIFKNSSGTVTLSVNVSKGGYTGTVSTAGVVTCNSATLGTVKWYASNAEAEIQVVNAAGTTVTLDTETGAASSSITISADKVANAAGIKCQLEG